QPGEARGQGLDALGVVALARQRLAEREHRGPGARILLGDAPQLGRESDAAVRVGGGAFGITRQLAHLRRALLTLARQLVAPARLERLEAARRLFVARHGLA